MRSIMASVLLSSVVGQPPIGSQYVTNIVMDQSGSRPQTGVLSALNDWTLFVQDRPDVAFPYQLNLGDHGGERVWFEDTSTRIRVT